MSVIGLAFQAAQPLGKEEGWTEALGLEESSPKMIFVKVKQPT